MYGELVGSFYEKDVGVLVLRLIIVFVEFFIRVFFCFLFLAFSF